MLVERDGELERLRALAADTLSGHGRVLALAGEAGIGKSTLLREFASRLPADVTCVWGMCDALFTPRPLGPVLDVAALLHALDDEGDPAGGMALFSRLLERLVHSGQPTVLIFEDVHWADMGTLDFIRFLGRRVALGPVLLIVSFRQDELGRDHPLRRVLGDLPAGQTERIELAPLSVEAVRAMAEGTVLWPEKLFEVTGGNPFFVTEILADSDGDATQVPVSVQDTVSGRLARLHPDHRRFLEAISVVPVLIDPRLHCGWIESAEEWIERSLEMGILVQAADRRFRFRHELARLATSGRCSSTELRGLHQRHLQAMLENPASHGSAEILHHAVGAADAAIVLAYAPDAATEAARLGAHREAAAYLEAALGFVDEAGPELAATLYERWAYEAGLSLSVNDRVIEARRHALTLWRAIGRTEKVAENLRQLSRLHWYRGESSTAARHLDESIRLLEALGNPAWLARAYSMRSQMLMLNSRMEEAIEWGSRALSIAEGEEAAEVRIHALNNIGTARLFLGDETGIPLLEESLELALATDRHEDAARVFTNLSEYAIDLRKLGLAETVVTRGIAFDTEHDLDSWTYYLLGRQAQLRLEQGRLTEAVAICQSVLEQPGQTLLMRLPARIMLSRAQLRMGEDGAAQSLEQAQVDALATGEVQYQIPVVFTQLEQAWLTGSSKPLRQALEQYAKIGPEGFSRWGLGEFAFWLRLAGEDLPPGVEPPEGPFSNAVAGNFEAAADAFLSLEAKFLGNLCRALGRSAADISTGLAELHAMGAMPMVRLLARKATDRGIAREDLRIPRGPYNAARGNALGLTAKEQAVLALLAEGLGNGEIAERLSRSRRTIEHHVSAILQKLSAENRLGAILRVQREPWLVGESAGLEE